MDTLLYFLNIIKIKLQRQRQKISKMIVVKIFQIFDSRENDSVDYVTRLMETPCK